LIQTDSKGKERKTYPYELMATPFEKLKSLPKAEQYLKEGITIADLEAKAMEMSDTEAADRMYTASREMLGQIFTPFGRHPEKAPLR
jgi:hypothetical protein